MNQDDIDETAKDDAAAALGDTFYDQDPVRELSEVEVVAHIALLEQEERQIVDMLHGQEQVNRLLDLFDDVDDALDMFVSLLEDVLNGHIPWREKRVKRL